jgi:hypothetical protein
LQIFVGKFVLAEVYKADGAMLTDLSTRNLFCCN